MAKPRKVQGFDPDESLETCLQEILAVRFEEVLFHTPKEWESPHADAVHDFRVAARRLQSLLKVFRPLFDDEAWRGHYKPIRQLVKLAGKVREADVFIGMVQGQRRAAAGAEGRTIALLLAQQQDDREEQLKPLREFVRSLEEGLFGDRFTEFIRTGYRKKKRSFKKSPLSLKESFRANARHVIPGLVSAMNGQVEKAIRHSGNIEELHVLRLKAKPLKYTMEIFRPALGASVRPFEKEVVGMIELLGNIHDADLFLEKLSKFRRQIELYHKNNEEYFSLKALQVLERQFRSKRQIELKQLEKVLAQASKGDSAVQFSSALQH
jgi:CHAD domain-containing protein